jgi:1,4-alpha-glucan branching enzyme
LTAKEHCAILVAWGVAQFNYAMKKTTSTKQKVTFRFTAPQAGTVQIAGDFTGWAEAPLAMKKDRSGTWKATVSLPPGRYEYRLLMDGQWTDDPQCPDRVPNQFGGENCVCVVTSAVAAGVA